MTQEDGKPAEETSAQDGEQPAAQAQTPMNRAERRAQAQGKKGAKGNAHVVNLPGAGRQATTRGAFIPPQQHTRSSNRGK